MSLNACPQQRVTWLAPESIPRQKAYAYILLICFTAVLIYLYSYPLKVENWYYAKQLEIVNAKISMTNVVSHDYSVPEKTQNNSTLLHKLFANLSDFVAMGKLLNTTIYISNKTILPQGLTEDPSKRLTTPVSAKAENVESQNKEGSSTMDNDSDVSNTAESDSAKISNFKATEDGGLLTAKSERKISPNSYPLLTSDEYVYDTTMENNVEDIQPTENEQSGVSAAKSKVGGKVNETVTPAIVYGETPRQNSTKNENEINPLFNEIAYQKNKGEFLDEDENFTGKGTEVIKSPNVPTKEGMVSNDNSIPGEESLKPSKANNTSAKIQQGFLVFSDTCRIPDLDPNHPSIRHLIETNPPLDCSEDHEPLTRTEGHVLILDERGVLEKAGGRNYSCCYKSVFRVDDGLSDDGVGFGEKCVNISNETIIEDEFITVECKSSNGTLLYKEFHSFIFDKPKVEKRCGKPIEDQYSVLIIGVDAVSRMNMHRQLNATADYLLKEMGAVEMYGYNKVGDNTFPNLIPLLLGYDERELPSICWKSPKLPLDRCNFLWKKYAGQGYRTLYAEDAPHISSFNYIKEGFLLQPTDYYFRPFIYAYEDALGRDKALNTHFCVGSISETEAILGWTEQFASHFSERPYFAFSWINSLTHDFLNMGSAGDEMYKKFFQTLHRSGALNKTIIILMSDHGMRWGAIRNTYIGRLEERLPMLLITLPEEFKQKFPRFSNALKDNSHKLVTPFDLHATLLHLLNLTNDWTLLNTDRVDDNISETYTKRALSLFNPIPEDRSCDDAYIDEHWCTCELSLEANVESDDVKQIAKFLLSSINDILKPVSNKCAFLTLDFISNAQLWQPSVEHDGHSFDDKIYTVTIKTNPSKAIFEGTVKLSQPKSKIELLGTISRLNLYKNQSLCVDNAILRKYCFCL